MTVRVPEGLPWVTSGCPNEAHMLWQRTDRATRKLRARLRKAWFDLHEIACSGVGEAQAGAYFDAFMDDAEATATATFREDDPRRMVVMLDRYRNEAAHLLNVALPPAAGG